MKWAVGVLVLYLVACVVWLVYLVWDTWRTKDYD